jgi:hypothetical protein
LCSNASSAALSEGVLQGFCSLLLHVGQEVGIDVQGDADRGRPEISSGIQAVRLGTVGLAMSDIYGGNAMQLTFFVLADLLAGTPVLPTPSAQSPMARSPQSPRHHVLHLRSPRPPREEGARARPGLAGGAFHLHRGCPAAHLRAWMMLASPTARGCPRDFTNISHKSPRGNVAVGEDRPSCCALPCSERWRAAATGERRWRHLRRILI